MTMNRYRRYRYGTNVYRADGTEPLPRVAYYRSALVFGLPESWCLWVERMRERLELPAPPEHQLVPHLTVLFLGRLPATSLSRLQYALADLGPVRVKATLLHLDVFLQGDLVINLHLRVQRSEDLLRLHERALRLYEREGLELQTVWVRDRWRPHVTIYDRLRLHRAQAPVPSDIRLPPSPRTLSDLHLMAKPVARSRAEGEGP